MKIIAAVEAIDDLNETGSVLSERLKEWYILNFENTRLSGEDLARKIIGMEETGESSQLKIMQIFSSSLLALFETRDRIEEYLKDNMPIIAPNITNIAGHILGARLLSIAGSLEKLAFMPSSTIQVIGANNALFKHLKGKAPRQNTALFSGIHSLILHQDGSAEKLQKYFHRSSHLPHGMTFIRVN